MAKLKKQDGEYSRQEIHKYLWNKSDRMHRVIVNQKAWAKDLGIANATIKRIMDTLRSDGRIKKIASRRMGIGVYVVRDPAQKEEWEPIPTIPKRKPIKVPDSDAVTRGI